MKISNIFLLYLSLSFPSCRYLAGENLQSVETLLTKLKGAVLSLYCNFIDFLPPALIPLRFCECAHDYSD